MPVTPFADTFLPLLILLATLVTAPKARLALLIVPFLPYDGDAFTAFIPALTALLNFERVLLPLFLIGTTISSSTNSSTGSINGSNNPARSAAS